MNIKLLCCAALAFSVSTDPLLPATDEAAAQVRKVRLNLVGFEHARQLILGGHVVDDIKGRWRVDQASTEKENEFIRGKGFADYAMWHLGIDDRHPENTKARYKFPFGDFVNVHRCGLIAVKMRAREYDYSEISVAADKLLSEIELTRPRW